MVKSNNTTLALVNGSLSTTKRAARVKNTMRVRKFMQARANRFTSEQVLSSTQSPFGLGSQFCAGTLTTSAEQLSTSAKSWIQTHDRYRIKEVEIFVTVTARSKDGAVDRNVPVTIYFYEDTDCESVTQTSWIRVSDRDNLGRVVVNSFTPSFRLITFTPTISFNPNTATSQSPANVILKKNTWLDALNLSQQMAGFRFFAASPQFDTSGQSYEFDVTFETRYTIDACQPI